MDPNNRSSLIPTSATLPRRTWVLLALDAAEQKSLTPVQLQKSLFILGMRRRHSLTGPFYNFRAYHYGPFDADVYRDSDALIEEGFVELHESRHATVRAYALSGAGRNAALAAKDAVSNDLVHYLHDVVLWAQSLSFDELVRAIYDAYPEMRVNSLFRDI